jgi:HAD superfamily hydrolase (TIGR01459 family)
MNAPPRILPPSPRLVRGLHELAPDYDVILCDVWGVGHNGIAYFQRATEALARFREKGGTVILLTNAPRPHQTVAAFLDRLGAPHDAYDGIVTAGDVTISLILERGDLPLAYIGPADDVSLFAEAERLAGKALRLRRIEDASYVVCIGLDDVERETPADYRPRFDLMLTREMEFICANPDLVVEMGDRLVPCAGALAEAYAAMGGKVIQAGKPYPPIYERALALAAELRGRDINRARILAVGDSIDTDIKGADDLALATLFVTNGIHRAALHQEERGGALDATALQIFVEDAGFAPMAAIAEFAW